MQLCVVCSTGCAESSGVCCVVLGVLCSAVCAECSGVCCVGAYVQGQSPL